MHTEQTVKIQHVPLLDFSGLGESRLYMDGVCNPYAHTEDGKYLREMIRHMQHNHSQHTSFAEEYIAETTDFPESEELKCSSFKLYLQHRDTTLTFDKCSWNTTFKEIVVRALLHWEPMDLSCSWLKSDAQDYVLQIKSRKEYIFDQSLILSDLVYVRNCISRSEMITFLLVEKSRIDSIILSSSSDTETQYPPSPFAHLTKTETCRPSHSIDDELVICLNKLDGLTPDWLKDFTCYASYGDITFCVDVDLCHNSERLCESKSWNNFRYTDLGKDLYCELSFPISIADLPREAYLRIYVTAKRESTTLTQKFLQTWIFMESPSPSLLGWSECSLYDFQGCLRVNPVKLPLKIERQLPMYLPSEYENTAYIVLSIKYKTLDTSHATTIFVDTPIRKNSPLRRLKIRERDWEKIQSGKASDTVFWKYRHHIRKRDPDQLIPLLKSVNWSDKLHLAEIHDLLAEYPTIYPFAGFEILALPIVDLPTREYAVSCLHSLSTKEIQSTLPQLIQSLKKDTYLSSPLAIFLLTRALHNRSIGHTFYWYLNSEMDDKVLHPRFHLLKQCYLENIDASDRRKLLQVERVFGQLIYIAELAQSRLSCEQLYSCLYEISFPERFYLPTSSKIEIKSLIVEKCSILNSKTKPLWLTFETVEGNEIYVILKVGDDIRVDVLALQMMNVLDSFWKKEGLDLHLQPYVALPLRKRVGLIQVASKAETTSTINWKHGGNGFASAFSSTSLKAYLYKNNLSEERAEAFQNFALSCAGYCVFTYAFGVGDRHGDNIMCTPKGNLFHIDFGYFLGERSKFLGFSRETNCFVLTSNYINAMDKFFNLFIELSCQGFVIAQRYESTFTTLITLMLPCGEDVITKDQVRYVKATLEPWLSETEGKKKFYDIIRRSLQDKRTLLNDFAHLIATRSGK